MMITYSQSPPQSIFFVMNDVLNHNRKVLEETLAGSNLDAVKTTLRGLHDTRMTHRPTCKFLKSLLLSFTNG